jgi:hypothetical protein
VPLSAGNDHVVVYVLWTYFWNIFARGFRIGTCDPVVVGCLYCILGKASARLTFAEKGAGEQRCLKDYLGQNLNSVLERTRAFLQHMLDPVSIPRVRPLR